MDKLRPSAALLGAQIALSAAIEREAVAATGRSATTVDLLLRIAESASGTARAVDLCRQLQLSAGYVSRRVERAEWEGLITRAVDPADRRSHVLALSPEGQRVVDDFRPRLEAVLDRVIFASLTERQRDTLIALLGRVEAAALDVLDRRSEPAAEPTEGERWTTTSLR